MSYVIQERLLESSDWVMIPESESESIPVVVMSVAKLEAIDVDMENYAGVVIAVDRRIIQLSSDGRIVRIIPVTRA